MSAFSARPCSRRFWKMNAEVPTRAIANVASRNGAPMIAPIATSSEPSEPPMIATIGIRVSGIAVPTAARMLPVAPSPTSRRWPSHSTAFVNTSAPARMIAKLMTRRIAAPMSLPYAAKNAIANTA